jgi:Leucine-rich repeat (LRR) protein
MDLFSQETIDIKINQLKDIIYNSTDEEKRVQSIHLLKNLEIKSQECFKFVENLLISDSNPKVRSLALNIIRNNFTDTNFKSSKSFEALSWAYEYENSIHLKLKIISTLEEIECELATRFLRDQINAIKVPEFQKYITKLMKRNEMRRQSNNKLANILKQYHVIKDFIENFELVRYRIENGNITELDFSFAYNNEFTKKMIEKLPGIICELKQLRSLNLKFNKLKKFPLFVKKLPDLKCLILSNNQIKTVPVCISEISSLRYLDLSWNNIQSIPEEITELRNIKCINLKYNKIPDFFHPLIKLKARGTTVYI